jgi:hypothetical protein
MKGSLNIKLIDENHSLKDERNINNLVVAVGKTYIANRMTSNSNTIMSHMAVGNGNVAPVVGDTILVGELARVALDSSSRTNNVITYVATFPAGTGTGSIAEAGIFNNGTANAGSMLCRTNFNVVNKGASDVIVITWNVTVA